MIVSKLLYVYVNIRICTNVLSRHPILRGDVKPPPASFPGEEDTAPPDRRRLRIFLEWLKISP